MFNHMLRLIPCFLLTVCTVFTPPSLFAQTQSEPLEAQEINPAADLERSSIVALVEALSSKRVRLRELQAELGSESAAGREDQITSSILEVERSIKGLEQNLSEILTTIPEGEFADSITRQKTDLTKEAVDLLDPLISGVKRITSRPREMSRLRGEVDRATERLVWANTALERLEEQKEQYHSQSFQAEHFELVELWKSRRQEARTALAVAEQQLSKKLGEQKSFAETAEEIFEIFFRSRGRNLFFALLGALLFWFAIRFVAIRFDEWERLHTYRSKLSVRVFNALLFIGRVFGSLFAFLLVLFVTGDWVLLALSITILVGLIWASRNTMPKVWGQLGLLLNLGPVREGERIDLDGVPFEVERINFFTTLSNPLLDSPGRRLPLKDLTDLRSREIGPDEDWFPSKTNDWVKLSDDVYGRVCRQTDSYVEIALKGGSSKVYPVSDYLASAPQILSSGFRIHSVFGLDYKHQAEITHAIPETLKQDFTEYFSEHFDGPKPKITIQFREAGASSLDLSVIIDFDGSLASEYEPMGRLVGRLCVESANRHGWEIPFPQLTVHHSQIAQFTGE